MDVLIRKKDVDVSLSVNEMHYSPDDIFSHTNGFNVAVAFTAYDNEMLWALDDSYGELVFKVYGWGGSDSGATTDSRTIDSHVCTADELGLSHSSHAKPTFLPITEESRPTIERYQKKFLCADNQGMYIYGDF